jgi:hypothetical protein
MPQDSNYTADDNSFLASSRKALSAERPAFLLDIGSPGNLTGAPWATRVAQLAKENGLRSKQTLRRTPLHVSGVGTGGQEAKWDATLPICLQTEDGRLVQGAFTTPILDTDLPSLLGLNTMVEQRAVIDLRKLTITFCGPDDRALQYPTGSDTYPLFRAKSGHLMLPCCQYDAASTAPVDKTLVLVHEETTESTESGQSSSSSSSIAPQSNRRPVTLSGDAAPAEE